MQSKDEPKIDLNQDDEVLKQKYEHIQAAKETVEQSLKSSKKGTKEYETAEEQLKILRAHEKQLAKVIGN